jgi:hypothetical protein
VVGDVDLPIFAHLTTGLVDEQIGVEALPAGRELGVAEAEADPQPLRLLEDELRFGTRHLRLEVVVVARDVIGVPPRKEDCEGELGIND